MIKSMEKSMPVAISSMELKVTKPFHLWMCFFAIAVIH